MRISKTLWQGALLALVTCGPAASLAQDAVEAATAATETSESGAAKAEAPKDEAKEAPARPFIERSLVIAPEQVGKFKLYGMTDFPGNPGAGISIRYQHEDFPTVRIDIFVYPAGKVDRDRILESGMNEVRATLEHAVSQGKYSDLSIGSRAPFDLRQVEADGSMKPEEVSTASASDGAEPTDAESAIADARAAQDYRRGLRMPARLTIQDEPQNSLAFLFYRGPYLVKGRISASPTLLPDEAFDRFANHAMASLVPVIATRSTGGCSQDDLVLADEDFKSEAILAGKLAAASEIAAQEDCKPTLDETLPAGHRAMPLVYDPEMWGGKR